jgi:phage/plasmid primase-like uncharacterized protein
VTPISSLVSGLKQQGHYLIGACPFCGGTDRFQIKRSHDGREVWFCRQCGDGRYHDVIDFVKRRDGCNYQKACETLDHEQTAVTVSPIHQQRQTAPGRWLATANELAARYAAHPRRFEMWAAYKALSAETINARNLGAGVLPQSQCRHERLIVPIYNEAGQVVNLRGRAIDCDCPKWLAPGGWSLDALPLYGLDALQPGGVLWVVENPVDALMIAERTPYAGAATLSVSYWRDAWTQAIIARQPSLVVVAYDNDLVGNGGANRRGAMLAAWRVKLPPERKNQRPPESNGAKIANIMLTNGIRATLYDWGDAPEKADIGGMI